LVIGFIEHSQNVTTGNYGGLTDLHTPKISVTASHIKSSQSSLAVARVAASNGGRSPSSASPNCPRAQLQHFSTDWLSLTVLLITSRQEPHRKHRFSVAVSNFCRAIMIVYEAVTQ
jgi:hypothetical protein